jgi:hypothetical protein
MGIIDKWHVKLSKLFFTGFILLLITACGLEKAQYIVYPKPELLEVSSQELCPIGLSAFTYHIAPMLALRCTNGCHTSSGNAAAILAFTGEAAEDSAVLKVKEDGSAMGLFRKARGAIPHRGGAAAEPEDEQRFKTWLAADRLCELDISTP